MPTNESYMLTTRVRGQSVENTSFRHVTCLSLLVLKTVTLNNLKSWPTAAEQFDRVCLQKSLVRDLNVLDTHATLLGCQCLLSQWQTIQLGSDFVSFSLMACPYTQDKLRSIFENMFNDVLQAFFEVMCLSLQLMKALALNNLKSWPTAAKQSTGCADRSPCFAIWMYQVHMLHYWVATVFYFDGKPPGWSRPSKQAADVWIGITSYFPLLEIVYENLLGHEHTSKRELNTSSHDHDDARGKPPLLIYPWRAQSTTEILDARQGKKTVAAGQLRPSCSILTLLA